jgi:hypothetical protein
MKASNTTTVIHFWIVIGMAVAALPLSASAFEVYQWTDQNGVVHFSQWAPADNVKNVERLDVPGGGEQDNGIGISEADDPEGYQAHRDQMDALWDDIDKRREAAKEKQSSVQTQVVYQNQDPNYVYPYYPRRFHPGHRPGNRPEQLPSPGRPSGPRPGPGGEMEVPVIPSVPIKWPGK